jgi:hypothetical protein
MNEEARKKALEYGIEAIHKYSDAMKELAEIERQELEHQFYRFFVVDYVANSEGRSVWLQICRYHLEERDYEYENFARFVPDDYYLKSFEELTEREFLDRYTRLLPDMIVHLLREKSLTIWQQHFHFNRS